MILPYYDTKTFTLVVKVLEVEKAKNLTQWLWLVPSIKTGTPVTKSALFSNANSTFVQWLFGTLDKFMEVRICEGAFVAMSTDFGNTCYK